MFNISLIFLTTILASAAVAAPSPRPHAIPQELGKKIVERYAELAHASYVQALKDAQELRKRIHALAKTPNEQTHGAAKQAWWKARDSYSRTEAFRFYGGPIDHPETGPEGLINAWPIDESYLDYVKGNPDAGIINNTKQFPKITKALLVEANEKNGEKNISTGYHAIEFLLWGQDFSLHSAGLRPAGDFQPKAGSRNAERRTQTLQLLAELLEEHLQGLTNAWKPNAPYVLGLKKESLDESLRRIYTGMVNLSIDEMAGERMTVALENNDQENEQDCFSDYTVADMISNELGIHEVYYGRIPGKPDLGVHQLIEAVNPELAKKTAAQMQSALKSLQALPSRFDQVIASKKSSPERKKANRAITELEEQARTLAKSGLDMGLILNIQ